MIYCLTIFIYKIKKIKSNLYFFKKYKIMYFLQYFKFCINLKTLLLKNIT